jgi:hypothetical protein
MWAAYQPGFGYMKLFIYLFNELADKVSVRTFLDPKSAQMHPLYFFMTKRSQLLSIRNSEASPPTNIKQKSTFINLISPWNKITSELNNFHLPIKQSLSLNISYHI